ncbi:hypothetical protein G7Y89_g9499 [Cudoniella acicularis]|uniref:Uncharacterized protein n=1 Tax=Cudoniella acicularis TaxID=354080 RepID=A0A8H4RGR4_9HELO|nr:hypothetical protein G7Y89_g9499 [Cudoniella acicularis]
MTWNRAENRSFRHTFTKSRIVRATSTQGGVGGDSQATSRWSIGPDHLWSPEEGPMQYAFEFIKGNAEGGARGSFPSPDEMKRAGYSSVNFSRLREQAAHRKARKQVREEMEFRTPGKVQQSPTPKKNSPTTKPEIFKAGIIKSKIAKDGKKRRRKISPSTSLRPTSNPFGVVN